MYPNDLAETSLELVDQDERMATIQAMVNKKYHSLVIEFGDEDV